MLLHFLAGPAVPPPEIPTCLPTLAFHVCMFSHALVANIIYFMLPLIFGLLGTHDRFTYLSNFWTSANLGDPEVVNFTRQPSSTHPSLT
jgi:hypothetical protein